MKNSKYIPRVVRILWYMILYFSSAVVAQPIGEWTWMHGDNIGNSLGNFGTQGVPSPNNKPPAVYEPCGEWRDNQGNFWFLGGARPDLVPQATYSALWKYDVATNQWTWMKGPSATNQAGVYGTKGVPSAANYPGSRSWGACTWVDKAGNFWLFGGGPYNAVGNGGRLNDLWKYDVTTNEWTWMNGPSNATNDPGSYGTKGVVNPANLPPCRDEAACSWVDNAGNLWLGGGYNTTGTTTTFIDDMWKYDMSANMWTWMHGPGIGFYPTVYGTLNVPASANTPGSVLPYATWTDLSGSFWLFDNSAMWMYNPAINQWAWKGGKFPSSYGTKCVPSATTRPRNKTEHRARVVDTCGNFWLFGSDNLSGGNSYGNDLWHYNVSTQQWMWVSGDNTGNPAPAVFGTKGTSAPANKPGGRTGGTAWVDVSGNIWIFGGWAENGGADVYLNDLWRFVPDSNCTPGCKITFASAVISTNILCNGQCTGTATSNPNGGVLPYTYSWNTTPVQTTKTVTGLCPGFYTVTVTDASGKTATSTITITQPPVLSLATSFANPPCNAACTGTASATASGGTTAYTYSWNVTPIQTSAGVTGLCSGNYTVIVTDKNGCTVVQPITLTEPPAITTTVSSTPNSNCASPNGTATVQTNGGAPGYTYSWSPSGGNSSAATGLSSGTYSITITDSNGCTAVDTTSVASTGNIPIVTLNTTPAGCNSDTGTVTAAVSGGALPYTYNWSNGQTTSAITGLSAGTYTVIVTDANGCAQAIATVIAAPAGPNANAGINVTITSGNSTTLTATGGGAYAWSNGDTVSSIIVSPAATTQYCVIVTDSSNCSDTACVMVFVEIDCAKAGELYLPNAFSPNDDGENDFLQLYYGNIKCIKDVKLVVYNRWGEKLFETTDPAFKWEGLSTGQPMNTEVLVYYFEVTLLTGEQIIKKGNVSLIR